MKLLILNLGSTSTKIAIYDDNQELLATSISHEAGRLKQFKGLEQQLAYRKGCIDETLLLAGYPLSGFDAVCSRGGPLKPVESGTYRIDQEVLLDAKNPRVGGRHPACLGLVIANEISQKYGIPAYFADPVSTDELIDEARLTGLKGMTRTSLFHALNQKSAARRAAQLLGKDYTQVNLIGIHMGGGTSVAAHRRGRVIDNYNILDEGCFSMDRPGSLPTSDIIELCYSGVEKAQVMDLLSSRSGVYSYLGTKDFREVERRVREGDSLAVRVFEAMVYQHVKCVGSMAAALRFQVDGIFLTGGIAHSKMMCGRLKDYIERLGPVIELPGENEMQSLAECVYRVLSGEPVKIYGKAWERGA